MARTSLADQLPGLLGPSRRSAWRRVVLRRLLAVVLLLAALQVAVAAARGPASGAPVVVATADVAAGEPIRAEHLRLTETRGEPVAGALEDPAELVGSRASVPIRSGEVLTAARGTGAGLLADAEDGDRAVSLPLLGPTDVSPGERVDVYRGGRAEPVVRDALVVAADQPSEDGLAPATSAPQSVVAVPSADAGSLVEALGEDATTGFVLALRP